MQRLARLFLLLLVTSVVATPAFAGGDCQVCQSTPGDGNTVWVLCVHPESGSWGADDCQTGCYGDACYCTEGGFLCLYYVVEG